MNLSIVIYLVLPIGGIYVLDTVHPVAKFSDDNYTRRSNGIHSCDSGPRPLRAKQSVRYAMNALALQSDT